MKAIGIITAILITLICVDFAARVIRYAATGKGKGKDFRFFWWLPERRNVPSVMDVLKDFGVWIVGRIKRPATVLCLASLAIGMIAGAVIAKPTNSVDAFAVEETPLPVQTAEPASVSVTDEGAAAVARVLYGIREYDLSDTAKRAVIEVIMNRANDKACEFRTVNTVLSVCQQPNQWQGYVSDGIYLLSDYELAESVLHDTSGQRVIPEGCFFLNVSHGKITARTKWNGGNEWTVE